MITLDILEQRLLPSPYFDACLVCLFSIIINPIFIFPIKTLRISIKIINRLFGDDVMIDMKYDIYIGLNGTLFLHYRTQI